MPPDWKADIDPDSATLRVGETVSIVVRSFDKAGALLPTVPYHLFTPQFFDPTRGKKPIVNRWSRPNSIEAVRVVAIDTGTTTLVGRIGSQQVTTKLKIHP